MKAPTKDISICASFPGKRPPIHKTLAEVLDDPKSLTHEDQSALPTSFKVSKIVTPGRTRFGGMKNFVIDIKALSTSFYGDIGQNLKAWVPPAPKVVIQDREEVDAE